MGSTPPTSGCGSRAWPPCRRCLPLRRCSSLAAASQTMGPAAGVTSPRPPGLRLSARLFEGAAEGAGGLLEAAARFFRVHVEAGHGDGDLGAGAGGLEEPLGLAGRHAAELAHQ